MSADDAVGYAFAAFMMSISVLTLVGAAYLTVALVP